MPRKPDRRRMPQGEEITAFPDVFRAGLTREQTEFLLHFIQHASINAAAKYSQTDRSRHYQWQRQKLYAECFLAAKGHIGDALENEAIRRAREGFMEPVFGREGMIGKRRRFSDSLLALVLQARHPAYARAAGISVHGTGIQIVQYGDSPPPSTWNPEGQPEPPLRVSLPRKDQPNADGESAVQDHGIKENGTGLES